VPLEVVAGTAEPGGVISLVVRCEGGFSSDDGEPLSLVETRLSPFGRHVETRLGRWTGSPEIASRGAVIELEDEDHIPLRRTSLDLPRLIVRREIRRGTIRVFISGTDVEWKVRIASGRLREILTGIGLLPVAVAVDLVLGPIVLPVGGAVILYYVITGRRPC
jgi:hypothetical protein